MCLETVTDIRIYSLHCVNIGTIVPVSGSKWGQVCFALTIFALLFFCFASDSVIFDPEISELFSFFNQKESSCMPSLKMKSSVFAFGHLTYFLFHCSWIQTESDFKFFILNKQKMRQKTAYPLNRHWLYSICTWISQSTAAKDAIYCDRCCNTADSFDCVDCSWSFCLCAGWVWCYRCG